MTAAAYINELLTYEEYAFSLEELLGKSSKTKTSLARELSRLVGKGEIINLRKGFYLILPHRYRPMGQLPIELYANKLFRYLNKDYYLALYSAARFHGAAHQQPQMDYVITRLPPLLDINKRGMRIRFFTTANWPVKSIVQKKSDAGYFNVSSPALTAADLVHHQTKSGGLNRVLAILEELSEEIGEQDMGNLLSWYPHKSALQRLGYLLDHIQPGLPLAEQLFDHVKAGPFYPVLLGLKKGMKAGATGNRWKVDVNINLESDL